MFIEVQVSLKLILVTKYHEYLISKNLFIPAHSLLIHGIDSRLLCRVEFEITLVIILNLLVLHG